MTAFIMSIMGLAARNIGSISSSLATGYHAMARLQMQVVAAMQRLLAVSSDIGSKMILVGRFVVGESRVAIEPVRAVLDRQVNDRGVEGDDTVNGLLNTLLEIGTNDIVLLLMLLKPHAVVVLCQLPQKLQYPFCIHNKPSLIVAKLRFSENKTKKIILFLSSVSNFALFTAQRYEKVNYTNN